MIDKAEATPPELTLWQIVLLVLSVYVLGALFTQTFWALDPEVARLLDWADTAICVVFLGDFVYHLASAPDRRAYLKWGWVDLVSSIPTVDMLRWGRAVRVLRILRVLRAVRSVRTLLAIVFARRAAGLLMTTGIASFLLVIGSAIAILNLEHGPAVKIHTASDALWWSFEMLISQGSGLYNPVTVEGRLLAAALSITGFVLLGAFVGGVSASVLGDEEEKIEREESEILTQVNALHERLGAIEARLGNPAEKT
jgi:voltage-gated potassium channel